MTLFTVGPVQMHASTLKIAGEQLPYFRDKDFSEVNKRVAKNIKHLMVAPEEAGVVFLTASGTGAMEAAVMNLFSQKDKLLIVNGGSFGYRFCEMCDIHAVPYAGLDLKFGEALTGERLSEYENKGFTGMLVNIHETSTGQLYDLEMLSGFCRRNHLIFVVDAISSFLADPFNFSKYNVDAAIISSQKALALSPGLSAVVLSEKAKKRIEKHDARSMYFDFKHYLKDMERGQTPFTPAVGVLIEMDVRLNAILEIGVETLVKQTASLAACFRERMKELTIRLPDYPLSNALTPILLNADAGEVYQTLKENYGLVLTPNGGELADKMLRVGHLGALTAGDYDNLIAALAAVIKGGA